MINLKTHLGPNGLLVLVLFLLPFTQAWSRTLYVSDELSIPMRTGASTKHRIVYFPKSGTPLTVKETSEDGSYVHVRSPGGKEGWVENQYLMGQPSARDRIVTVNKMLEKTRAEVKDLKQQVSELETQNNEMTAQLKQSQREIKSMEGSMEQLKRISANPAALARENKTLQAELSKLTASNTLLEEENVQLADDSTKDWFMLGAAVSLGSLLF
ncbi:MAG: TIGR04211 family SH3 domain-containing protein, partial [Gammaproteobacteria bacterium]